MNENLFMCIYLFFILIVILISITLTPKFTRKEIVFGVRVPEDKADSDEIEHIKAQFIRNNLVVGIPFILLFSFLNYKFLNVGMIVFTTFAFVFINFLVYMISNRAVKNLKSQKLWFQGKKQVVTIDIDFSKKKSDMLVSVWFFMIPVFIIIINIILGYTHYSSLPYKVPTHWDFSGNITGYQIKSKFLIWEMPLAQIIITFISFIVYKGIGWSKQQISSLNPEESVKKNSIFRRSWSIYMVILASATDILLSVGTIQIFKVIDVSSAFSNAVIIAFLTIIILASIILSLKIGQGGSNIKMGKDSLQRDESELTNKDDDDSWKLANTIYYNPEDPSIFVEKRFGVGWTVNAGRPAGMAIYIGIIVFTIVVIGISIFAQS